MGKLIKWILYFLLALVLLIMIAAIALVNIVNPNDYKTLIEKNFYQSTGRNLTISGNIAWEFFPSLGFSMGAASIQNPAGYSSDQPFASISSIQISLEPWSLIHKEILIENISINGLVLNLIEKSATENNWTFNISGNTSGNISDQSNQASQSNSASNSAALPLFLGINNFQILHSEINFSGLEASQNWNLKSLNISASHFSFKQVFPVKIQGDFIGQAPLKILLDLNANIQIEPNSFDLKNLNAKINESNLTGKMHIENFKAPHIQAEYMLDQIDLAEYVNLQGARLLLGATTLKLNLKLDGLAPNQIPSSLNGNIHADVANMNLKGVDLGKMISSTGQVIQSLAQGQNILSALSDLKKSLPAFSGSGFSKKIDSNNGQETLINNFSYNAEVKNGVMTNPDLILSGPNFQVKGAGVVDLNQEKVAYKLAASGSNQGDFTLPIIIQGPFSDVHSGIDMSDLSGQIQSMFLAGNNKSLGGVTQQRGNVSNLSDLSHVGNAIKDNSKKLLNNLKSLLNN